MKIYAYTVCNKFWNRLEFCERSWAEASERLGGNLTFIVATIDDHLPSDLSAHDHLKIVPVRKEHVYLDGIESKSLMIRSAMMTVPPLDATHVLMTDADIVWPSNLTPESIDPSREYQVADRIDLGEQDTLWALRTGIMPKIDGLQVNESKTGMGWFQLMTLKTFQMFAARTRWDEWSGYDRFDWELDKSLSATYGRRKIECSPFVHLWHGAPGSTWKGTKSDL